MPDFARQPHDFSTGETPAASVFDGLAGGIAGAVTASSATGGIGASEVTLLSRVMTLNADKSHLFVVQFNLESTVANDVFRIRLKDGSTELDFRRHWCRTASEYETVTLVHLNTSLAGGSHTFTVTAERVAGSGTGNDTAAAASPHLLACIELGPSS